MTKRTVNVVITKNNNPILKRYSIAKLKTMLDLPTDRILKLLDNDQIYIDQYDNVLIKSRSAAKYTTTKICYKKQY